MDKPSTSGLPQSTGRRVRLIPATPRPVGRVLPASQPVADPRAGTSQPPETFGGNLYSNIIKEAMGRLNREGMEEEEKNSIESSNDDANPSGTQTSPTSSSSLRFSDGGTFEEIASEVIRRMRKEERERISGEMQKLREPLRVPMEEENRVHREDPIREILDLTGTDEEEATASGDWRIQMENTVNMLLVENAEQNTMLKAQREQMTKMIDIVDRVISCMDGGPQSSHRPSPAISAAGENEPSQNALDPNLVGTSRKKRQTNQPPSKLHASFKAKRTKHSGPPGGQKKN